MQKNTDISERILIVIDYYHISKNIFAKNLGYNRSQTIYDVINGKSAPSFDFFNRFVNSEYSEKINTDWLLTGNGEMLKSDTYSNESRPIPSYYVSKNGIPLVDAKVVAGFGNNTFAIHESDVKEYYVVPKFKDRTIDFMIEVSGASMYPKYASGDVIACTILRESRFIQWGKVYVLGTVEQGLLIKRIYQCPGKENDCLMCYSDNEKYPPFEIRHDEITGMALVVGVVRLE